MKTWVLILYLGSQGGPVAVDGFDSKVSCTLFVGEILRSERVAWYRWHLCLPKITTKGSA